MAQRSVHAFRIVALASALFLLSGSRAAALPIVNLQYVETALADGTFRYDYTFVNASDPIADAGSDLYDVFLSFSSGDTPLAFTAASGWDAILGLGFVNFLSLAPGPAPGGSDIAPGTQLGGFSVSMPSAQTGPLFDALLVNPLDPARPAGFTGTPQPAGSHTVPEPATALLVGAGVLLYARRSGRGFTGGRRG